VLLYCQIRDLSLAKPRYREFNAGALAPYAECFWRVLAPAGDPSPYPVLPDGCIDIVFWPTGGLRVVGTMTRQQMNTLPPGAEIIGVRFRPGMAGAFLRGVAREVVDRWMPLEDVWGTRGRALNERLNEAPAREWIAKLARALPQPDTEPGALHRAITAITAAGGSLDIGWAADQAGLSPRQFRRRCIEETGLAPKQLCRVLRFRRAVSLAPLAHRFGWAHVAAECRYWDQAHLINDFREFSGRTPVEFARDRFFQDAPEPVR
jgi:AraC-like DNA-binding protein